MYKSQNLAVFHDILIFFRVTVEKYLDVKTVKNDVLQNNSQFEMNFEVGHLFKNMKSWPFERPLLYKAKVSTLL